MLPDAWPLSGQGSRVQDTTRACGRVLGMEVPNR